MSRFRIDWTPERIERLRNMRAAQAPLADIQAACGCSKGVLIRKLRELGLTERVPGSAEATRSRFAEALAEEGQIAAAAQRAGVTRTTGYRLFAEICTELGWQAR